MNDETIYQRVGALLHEGHAPEDAALLALQGMSKAELMAFVLPEVERLARTIERSRVRRVERRAFSRNTGIESRPDAVKALLAESFIVDGEIVGWGQATAEQHLARAQWQRGCAAEIVADAERHERAAALITAAGVTCLDELNDKELVP